MEKDCVHDNIISVVDVDGLGVLQNENKGRVGVGCVTTCLL